MDRVPARLEPWLLDESAGSPGTAHKRSGVIAALGRRPGVRSARPREDFAAGDCATCRPWNVPKRGSDNPPSTASAKFPTTHVPERRFRDRPQLGQAAAVRRRQARAARCRACRRKQHVTAKVACERWPAVEKQVVPCGDLQYGVCAHDPGVASRIQLSPPSRWSFAVTSPNLLHLGPASSRPAGGVLAVRCTSCRSTDPQGCNGGTLAMSSVQFGLRTTGADC